MNSNFGTRTKQTIRLADVIGALHCRGVATPGGHQSWNMPAPLWRALLVGGR